MMPAGHLDAMQRLSDRQNASGEAGNSLVEGFEQSIHKIKEQVLPRLLERVDPEAAATLDKDELAEEFRPIIGEVLAELKLTLNRREQFALEQVLVTAGLSDLLARLVMMYSISPLVLGWLVAVGIRLAAGSTTVATITAVGIMPGVVMSSGVSPELVVLAIGAGSVFFSHVNDPGFWLVKGYVGTSTADTFRTWSMLETTISVAGLIMVLGLSYIV
jgi:hypothetical protein